MLVLEELSHALDRGAPIVAEVCGYSLSGDAYHATSPSPEGDGAKRAMKSCMEMAQLSIHDIGYINAHATSTPMGDAIESNAIGDMDDISTSIGCSKLTLIGRFFFLSFFPLYLQIIYLQIDHHLLLLDHCTCLP